MTYWTNRPNRLRPTPGELLPALWRAAKLVGIVRAARPLNRSSAGVWEGRTGLLNANTMPRPSGHESPRGTGWSIVRNWHFTLLPHRLLLRGSAHWVIHPMSSWHSLATFLQGWAAQRMDGGMVCRVLRSEGGHFTFCPYGWLLGWAYTTLRVSDGLPTWNTISEASPWIPGASLWTMFFVCCEMTSGVWLEDVQLFSFVLIQNEVSWENVRNDSIPLTQVLHPPLHRCYTPLTQVLHSPHTGVPLPSHRCSTPQVLPSHSPLP